MTAKEALKRIKYIADKLANWNGTDISELDDEYDYSNLFIKVKQALTNLRSWRNEILL